MKRQAETGEEKQSTVACCHESAERINPNRTSGSSPLGTETETTIAGIMRSHGGRGGIAEFHAAVNVTFHEFESESYDSLHADMWQSVPKQIGLLVDGYVQDARLTNHFPKGIRVLDIGCGTGLATDSLLKSAIGPHVQAVDLIDTSPAMLRQAKKRSSQWNVPVTFHEGVLDSLDSGVQYEWIIASSVLHHIPNVHAFVDAVRQLQAPQGVFLHIQDPNGDFIADPELRERMRRRTRSMVPAWMQRLTPRRIMGRIVRELTGRPLDILVWNTNRALLDRHIVATPLTVNELYAIVDIHVQNEKGISTSAIQKWRPDWKMISRVSYGFFGALCGTLPLKYRRMEEELTNKRAPNGYHVGALWQVQSGRA